jgi:hypothetical protein
MRLLGRTNAYGVRVAAHSVRDKLMLFQMTYVRWAEPTEILFFFICAIQMETECSPVAWQLVHFGGHVMSEALRQHLKDAAQIKPGQEEQILGTEAAAAMAEVIQVVLNFESPLESLRIILAIVNREVHDIPNAVRQRAATSLRALCGRSTLPNVCAAPCSNFLAASLVSYRRVWSSSCQ